MKWLEHEIDEDGTKLNEEKVKAVLELKHPENPRRKRPEQSKRQSRIRVEPPGKSETFSWQSSIWQNSYQDCQKEPTRYENC